MPKPAIGLQILAITLLILIIIVVVDQRDKAVVERDQAIDEREDALDWLAVEQEVMQDHLKYCPSVWIEGVSEVDFWTWREHYGPQ